jgi:hypothetical protein
VNTRRVPEVFKDGPHVVFFEGTSATDAECLILFNGETKLMFGYGLRRPKMGRRILMVSR